VLTEFDAEGFPAAHTERALRWLRASRCALQRVSLRSRATDAIMRALTSTTASDAPYSDPYPTAALRELDLTGAPSNGPADATLTDAGLVGLRAAPVLERLVLSGCRGIGVADVRCGKQQPNPSISRP